MWYDGQKTYIKAEPFDEMITESDPKQYIPETI